MLEWKLSFAQKPTHLETYARHNILLLAQILFLVGRTFATSNALGHLVTIALRNLNFKGISRPTDQNQCMEITPLELGIALASMSLQEHLNTHILRVIVELFALQKGVHVHFNWKQWDG